MIPPKQKSAMEIAGIILYSPVTNDQHYSSLANGMALIEEYATQQQSIATGEIREENELLKKEIELLRSIIGGIHKNVLDIKYSSAIKPFLHFATYVEEVTNLPQPPTKVKGE